MKSLHQCGSVNVVVASNGKLACLNSILKGGYLQQLCSYLRTQERLDDPASLSADGLLLHPQIGGAVDEAMEVQGHRMRFKTIDLTAPLGEFEQDLRRILDGWSAVLAGQQIAG